ncbi:MAG: 1-deoxy-D-xylulose-5-phosphate reductoisomerase [Phycisphaerae bacterium]|nr:1-deoxy-D-xylulose-5-phosphate reductoisomerase [Phycisphaerae bacterium]
MQQRIAILGSTGSIGQSTLEVVDHLNSRCRVVGLAAGSRVGELARQAHQYNPACVAIADSSRFTELSEALGGQCTVLNGERGLVQLVEQSDCDCVVAAIVGAAGLPATLRAVELGKTVALANKETLVVAGSIIMPLARRTEANLIPIDSEHSAIYQAMHAGRKCEVRKVYLTASGGPFRTTAVEEMENATLQDALNHPTWSMGPKITLDSATMMNKALEIVEAKWLFDLQPEQIEVVIHPESIIHSLVEFCDGSVVAQLGTPDMRTPIQYAITYPERLPGCCKPLDLVHIGRMNFHAPDFEKFSALRLGYEAARRGGTAGAVLSAANETAVELFRAGGIRFGEIVEINKQVLEQHEFVPEPTIAQLFAADQWARNEVKQCLTC